MPTAARRAKQKQAKAKAETESEANKAARRAASKSTQTGLEAESVHQIVQKYWQMLDRRGLDGAVQKYQFIVSLQSTSYSSQASTSAYWTKSSQHTLAEDDGNPSDREHNDDDAGDDYGSETEAGYAYGYSYEIEFEYDNWMHIEEEETAEPETVCSSLDTLG